MTDDELKAALRGAGNLAALQEVLTAFEIEFEQDNRNLDDRGIDVHALRVYGPRPADRLDLYSWDETSAITLDSRGRFATVPRVDV